MHDVELHVALDPALVAAGCRIVVRDLVPAPSDPAELVGANPIELITADGWPVLVARRPGGGLAVCTFHLWACVIELHAGALPLEALYPALRAARPLLTGPASLLGATGAASPDEVRPLPPAAGVDFTGWSRRDRVDGAELTSDAGEGRIEIREGCPPSRRSRRAANLAMLREHAPSAQTSFFTTAGGEHGGMVTVRGEIIETVAWLIGDGADLEITAAARPGSERLVELLVGRLLHEYTFGGARERLRRFLYAPPAGWQGLCRGLHTDWFAPGYPERRAQITVLPASPRNETERHAGIDGLLRGPLHEADLRILDLESVDGRRLSGRRIRKLGPGRLVEEVVLQDDRFHYPFRLVCDRGEEEQLRATFRALWDSTVPLALAGRATYATHQNQNQDVFQTWMD